MLFYAFWEYFIRLRLDYDQSTYPLPQILQRIFFISTFILRSIEAFKDRILQGFDKSPSITNIDMYC